MNREFIQYGEALALKELGFNEDSFAKYNVKLNPELRFMLNSLGGGNNYNDGSFGISLISAPLYQQAFKWFREKYKLHSIIRINFGDQIWFDYLIQNMNINQIPDTDYVESNRSYPTYEEAELICLQKLIEIVKQKINIKQISEQLKDKNLFPEKMEEAKKYLSNLKKMNEELEIPSAYDFIGKWLIENTGIKGEPKDAYFTLHMLFDPPVAHKYISKAMIDYAIIVKNIALRKAYNNAKIVHDDDPRPFGGPFVWVDEKSILEAYPDELIKKIII